MNQARLDSLARHARATLIATRARIESWRPSLVVAALVSTQWVGVAVVALHARHDGWIYDTAHRPGPGVVSALPAIVVAQVLLLLPAALLLVHRVASMLAGPVFAAWAGAVWVLLPFLGIVYANRSFRHVYVDGFLAHLLGLTADPALPAMAAFLAAGFLALRVVDGGTLAEAAAAAVLAAAGAAFVPRAAVVALAPVAVLAAAGRVRQTVLVGTGVAGLLAGVAAAVSADLLPDPFIRFGASIPGLALSGLSEDFWSGRVLEWLMVGGLIGVLRRSRPTTAFLAVASGAGLLSTAAGPDAASRNLALLHGALPVWFASCLAVAAIPLLAPAGNATAPAAEIVRRAWGQLRARSSPTAGPS